MCSLNYKARCHLYNQYANRWNLWASYTENIYGAEVQKLLFFFRKIITRKGITLSEVLCVLVCRLRNLGSELPLKFVCLFFFAAIWGGNSDFSRIFDWCTWKIIARWPCPRQELLAHIQLMQNIPEFSSDI